MNVQLSDTQSAAKTTSSRVNTLLWFLTFAYSSAISANFVHLWNSPYPFSVHIKLYKDRSFTIWVWDTISKDRQVWYLYLLVLLTSFYPYIQPWDQHIYSSEFKSSTGNQKPHAIICTLLLDAGWLINHKHTAASIARRVKVTASGLQGWWLPYMVLYIYRGVAYMLFPNTLTVLHLLSTALTTIETCYHQLPSINCHNHIYNILIIFLACVRCIKYIVWQRQYIVNSRSHGCQFDKHCWFIDNLSQLLES